MGYKDLDSLMGYKDLEMVEKKKIRMRHSVVMLEVSSDILWLVHVATISDNTIWTRIVTSL